MFQLPIKETKRGIRTEATFGNYKITKWKIGPFSLIKEYRRPINFDNPHNHTILDFDYKHPSYKFQFTLVYQK